MLSREVALTLGIIQNLYGFSAITSVKEQLFQYYILLIYQHCMVNHYPTPMLGYQNLPDISLKRVNLNPMVDLHVHERLIKYSLESRYNVETSKMAMASNTIYQFDQPHGFSSVLRNRRQTLDYHYSQCH